MKCITCDLYTEACCGHVFVVVRGSNGVLPLYMHSVSLQRMGLSLKNNIT